MTIKAILNTQIIDDQISDRNKTRWRCLSDGTEAREEAQHQKS